MKLEIREFAESIVFGKSLNEKLIKAGNFCDDSPHFKHQLPILPARASQLEMLSHGKKSPPVPSIGQLEDPLKRGQLLHFFANHELLALELMGLALLKFPEAPREFRRDLISIMYQEQSHLKMYIRQMKRLGVEFGEFPLNGFFWKCISGMTSPLDFTVQMSLTFEQANLDHCLYYEKAFLKNFDNESAEILKKVYRDEISHVEYGWQWFEKFRPKEDATTWESYCRLLPDHISPARAKGRIFDKGARQRAGIAEDFIAELEIFSQSKGRAANVYYFYPFVEEDWAHYPMDYNLPKRLKVLKNDLESLPMYLASNEDILLVRSKPSAKFLRKISQAGFKLPEFINYDSDGLPTRLALSTRKVGDFCPWGWSPRMDGLLKHLKGRVVQGSFPLVNQLSNEVNQKIYSKTFGQMVLEKILLDINKPGTSPLLCPRDVIGKTCFSAKEIIESIKLWDKGGYKQFVAKASFGASGSNQMRFEKGDLPTAWIKNQLIRYRHILIEPWLAKVFEFSLQINVLSHNRFSKKGIARFQTHENGKYRGALLGSLDVGLDESMIREIRSGNGKFSQIEEILQNVSCEVTKQLSLVGYTGPVGIDAFFYRDLVGKLKLKPIVEINPRFNMGALTVSLQKHLSPRRVGLWLIVSKKELQQAGYSSVLDFSESMEKRHPLLLCKNDSRIDSGFLATTDPFQVECYFTFLLVGLNASVLKSWLEAAKIKIDIK